jgi:hypothetical protein
MRLFVNRGHPSQNLQELFETPPDWELCTTYYHTMMAISSLSEAAQLECAYRPWGLSHLSLGLTTPPLSAC